MLILGTVILSLKVGRSRRRNTALAWVVVAVAVIFAGFPLQQSYLRNRYVSSGTVRCPPCRPGSSTRTTFELALSALFRICNIQFYGKTLSNYVQYLGVRVLMARIPRSTSCQAWREAIEAGDIPTYCSRPSVVSKKSELSSAEVPEMGWTASDTNSKVVLGGQLRPAPPYPGYLGYTLYRVGSQFSTDGCEGFTSELSAGSPGDGTSVSYRLAPLLRQPSAPTRRNRPPVPHPWCRSARVSGFAARRWLRGIDPPLDPYRESRQIPRRSSSAVLHDLHSGISSSTQRTGISLIRSPSRHARTSSSVSKNQPSSSIHGIRSRATLDRTALNPHSASRTLYPRNPRAIML